MAKGKRSIEISKEGDLVVKNKKFKKSDIFAFGICLVVALVIWIYATNVKMNETREIEKLQEELKITQQE